MDKRTAICEFLKMNHRGKHRAVYSRELQRLFCIDGRNLRRKISSLRKDGFPICSDESGYYYAQDQAEINSTVCRMNELLTSISNARTGLLYSSVLPDCSVTLEVTVKIKQEVPHG